MGIFDRLRQGAPPREPSLSEGRVDLPRGRLDGWANELTGLGTSSKDKRLGAAFSLDAELISQEEAEEIWRGDDMADRMVQTVPNEMLRAGFYVDVKDDSALGEEIDAMLRDLGVADALLRALYYSRAYGGGALIPGVNDGRSRAGMLREENIDALTHVNVFSPSELYAIEWYVDPFAAKYGLPRLYELIPLPLAGVSGAKTPNIPVPVHESRVIRMDGQVTSPEHLRSTAHFGWGDSIFVRVLKVIRDFQSVWDGAAILMQDFAPPVLKMNGLSELLAASKANPNGLSIRDRLAAVEISRSIARLVLLDKDEEFKRETTNIAGLPEMLEKFMARLASAADMPGLAPGRAGARGAERHGRLGDPLVL
jgi:phage-related protein (TIGR01555 family)